VTVTKKGKTIFKASTSSFNKIQSKKSNTNKLFRAGVVIGKIIKINIKKKFVVILKLKGYNKKIAVFLKGITKINILFYTVFLTNSKKFNGCKSKKKRRILLKI